MRRNRDFDRERAITLITRVMIDAPPENIRTMLCLSVGHPAAVRITANGHTLCARCGAHMPLDYSNWDNVGPNLWTFGKLTPTDLLLTGLPKVEKVPV